MARDDPQRSGGPRWGQDFLVSFLSTEKRNSRVRRETKRPAHAIKKNTETSKAKAGARSTPYKSTARKARNQTPSARDKKEHRNFKSKSRCAEHTLQKHRA
jgi:hypothetical protein